MSLTTGLVLLWMSLAPKTNSQGDNLQNFTQLAKQPPASLSSYKPIGNKSLTDRLHLSISLNYGDPSGMQRFVDAVSDPTNPLYRHYLTPDQIGKKFGISDNRVQRLRDYFVSQGFQIQLTAKNRLSILADATVQQVQSAFKTTIAEFAASGGISRFSFTGPLSVPSEIAGDILDVGGMENFTQPKALGTILPFSPNEIRTLYGLDTLYNAQNQGASRTIGITNFDGFTLANEAKEVEYFGLPIPAGGVMKNITVESVSGGTGQSFVGTGEGDLDIQSVIAMAPLSKVIIYDNFTGTGTYDEIAVLTREAEDNSCDIVTESYGHALGSSSAAAAHNLHLAMSAQGITYVASSGDGGTDFTVNGTVLNYPDTDPEVLCVGGTMAQLNDDGTRFSEVGWDDPNDGRWNGLVTQGGGGWIITSDAFNTRPVYQQSVGFDGQPGVSILGLVNYRLFPDISSDADGLTGGHMVFYNNALNSFWGTSCASPTVAASLAAVEQELISNGSLPMDTNGHQRLGRIQDALYSYNGDGFVFYDVVSGTNGTLPNGQTSQATTGWDTVSGWGTVYFPGLLAALEAAPIAVSGYPNSITGGQPSNGTVEISSPAPNGGLTLSLSSSNPAIASVPKTVTVPAGSRAASFQINTRSLTKSQSAVITATHAGTVATTKVSVNPLQLDFLFIDYLTLYGGETSTAIVRLSGPSPSSGAIVQLSSSNQAVASVPPTIAIGSGDGWVSFEVTTKPVQTPQSVTITATYGGASKKLTMTVNPLQVVSISLNPSALCAGTSCNGTVTIQPPAMASGTTVLLTTSNLATSLPVSSVTVAPGSSSADFSVNTVGVTTLTSGVITASIGKSSASQTITVLPAILSGLSLSTQSIIGGTSATATLTLTGVAAAKGLQARVSSSGPSANVPASVQVAPGKNTATFTITTKPVLVATNATISVTIGTLSLTATLTIQPPPATR